MKPGCVVEVEEAVPKVMSVALIELVEMTATLNVVVSINSTTVNKPMLIHDNLSKLKIIF